MTELERLLLAVAHVKGQAEVKRRLAWVLRRQQHVAAGRLPDAPAGAIATGSTGVGKTYLIRSMCAACGLPFAEIKATQYTEKGYVGPDLEQMFLHLMQAAADQLDGERPPGAYRQDVDAELFRRGDLEDVVERAQLGVVLLDEFDKWMGQAGRDDHGRNKGRSLQYELLTILEGADVWVSDSEDELGQHFNTARVLVVAAGAFYGPPSLATLLRRRLAGEEVANIKRDEPAWDLLEPIDFQDFGVVPELAGRLTVHLPFRDLRAQDMAAILTEEGGLIEEYQLRAHEDGIELEFEEGALTAIGDVAAHRDTGARGLRHVLEQLLAEPLTQRMLEGRQDLVVTAGEVRAGRVNA